MNYNYLVNTLAIDLGGTTTKIAIISKGEIQNRWVIETNKRDLWNNIVKTVSLKTINEADVIGVCMPGFIKHESGIVTLSGNLDLNNYPAKSAAEAAFKRPVYILNDANAAALGEYWKGAQKKYRSLLFYTLGTGIGGGVIINGELFSGKDGYAGEFGHGGNFQNEKPCPCGLKNCIEPISSALGITKNLNAKGHHLDVKEALSRIEAGDVTIREIVKESLRPLATHMCIMQTALNTDAIIVGGGPSANPKPLLSILQELIVAMQLDFVAKSTEIVIAKTGNDAGLYGAAYYAMSSQKGRI